MNIVNLKLDLEFCLFFSILNLSLINSSLILFYLTLYLINQLIITHQIKIKLKIIDYLVIFIIQMDYKKQFKYYHYFINIHLNLLLNYNSLTLYLNNSNNSFITINPNLTVFLVIYNSFNHQIINSIINHQIINPTLLYQLHMIKFIKLIHNLNSTT